ncbi:hypothetical protein CCHR01_10229 [Colletotrichum chrysophilum]|uniref:Uncharacterized protein n=1 Tax=Colletotrichum chrysophilum TaxID=1836956 RepID=A0AAD9AFF7_9PEZI|nr:hypothetical protein CCHR01_10229 [Colletotrichum chrysophilum]
MTRRSGTLSKTQPAASVPVETQGDGRRRDEKRTSRGFQGDPNTAGPWPPRLFCAGFWQMRATSSDMDATQDEDHSRDWSAVESSPNQMRQFERRHPWRSNGAVRDADADISPAEYGGIKGRLILERSRDRDSDGLDAIERTRHGRLFEVKDVGSQGPPQAEERATAGASHGRDPGHGAILIITEPAGSLCRTVFLLRWVFSQAVLATKQQQQQQQLLRKRQTWSYVSVNPPIRTARRNRPEWYSVVGGDAPLRWACPFPTPAHRCNAAAGLRGIPVPSLGPGRPGSASGLIPAGADRTTSWAGWHPNGQQAFPALPRFQDGGPSGNLFQLLGHGITHSPDNEHHPSTTTTLAITPQCSARATLYPYRGSDYSSAPRLAALLQQALPYSYFMRGYFQRLARLNQAPSHTTHTKRNGQGDADGESEGLQASA